MESNLSNRASGNSHAIFHALPSPTRSVPAVVLTKESHCTGVSGSILLSTFWSWAAYKTSEALLTKKDFCHPVLEIMLYLLVFRSLNVLFRNIHRFLPPFIFFFLGASPSTSASSLSSPFLSLATFRRGSEIRRSSSCPSLSCCAFSVSWTTSGSILHFHICQGNTLFQRTN